MAYESYNAYLSIIPSTPEELYVQSLQDIIKVDFEDASTIKTVKHNGINVVVRVVGVYNKESTSKRIESLQKIIFKESNYTVSVGDIFEFDSIKWICTDVGGTPVTKSCSVQKANNTLTFYKSSVLFTLPCIISAVGNSIGMDIDENRYISDLSNLIIVRVPDNATSQLIQINDIFKIGRRNYKVLTDSDIVENGLLIFKMEVVVEEVETHTLTLNILNGATASINTSQTLQLNCEVRDNNEIVSPTPAITYSSSDITKATTNSSGLITALATGSVVITAKLTSDLTVLDTLNLTVVADVTNNYTYTLTTTSTPENEIKSGQTKIFTAKKFNNGVEVVGTQFDFTIIPDSGVPISAYTFSVIDDFSSSLKCNQYLYYVTLMATDRNTPANYVEKYIKLRSIF